LFLFTPNAYAAAYSASDLLGQLDGSNNPVYTQGSMNNGSTTNSIGFNQPYATELDNIYHRFFVADSANCRVLVFNLDSNNNFVDRIADNVLGQADFTSNSCASTPTASSMNLPRGLAFDSANNRLFIADQNNQRVLVFDTLSSTPFFRHIFKDYVTGEMLPVAS